MFLCSISLRPSTNQKTHVFLEYPEVSLAVCSEQLPALKHTDVYLGLAMMLKHAASLINLS